MVTTETAVGPPMLCANATRAPSHPRRPWRMPLGLWAPAGVYRQRTADTCHFSLDKLVAPESLGKAEIFIADQFDSREEIVNFGDVDIGGCHACHRKRLLGGTCCRRKRCHIRLVLMHHRVQSEADTADPHRTIGEPINDILGRQHQGGGAADMSPTGAGRPGGSRLWTSATPLLTVMPDRLAC